MKYYFLAYLFRFLLVTQLFQFGSPKVKVGGGGFGKSGGGGRVKTGGGGTYGNAGGGYGSNYGGGVKTGKSGGSIGGISKGTLGKVAVGALGGYFAAKVGSKIARGTSMMFYPQYNRHYWMGNRYYQQSNHNMLKCVYEIDEDDNLDMEYDSGGRVKQIIYECRRYAQRCCGMDCCDEPSAYHPSQGSWWPILLAIIVFCAVAALVVFMCKRYVRARNAARFSSLPSKPEDPGPGWNQPPPPQFVPQQPSYPMYPPPPQAGYPQPPLYGFQQQPPYAAPGYPPANAY